MQPKVSTQELCTSQTGLSYPQITRITRIKIEKSAFICEICGFKRKSLSSASSHSRPQFHFLHCIFAVQSAWAFRFFVNNLLALWIESAWPDLTFAISWRWFFSNRMESFMQRHQSTPNSPVSSRDASCLPASDCFPETDQALPDSFADWLAQPAEAITGGLEQAIFAGILNEFSIQTSASPSARPFQG